MPMQRICPLIEARPLTADIWSFLIEAGEMAETAKPGQFVSIACGEGRLLRRPISICDAGAGMLWLVFQVRGEGTAWLSRCRAGQTLDVLGPLGTGYTYPPEGKVLVVGGGIGVPPMLFAAKAAPNGAAAALGFRNRGAAILLEDFAQAGCPVHLTSDDGSIGQHGFVDALVREILAQDPSISAVFACGPKLMLRSVSQAAAQRQVPCSVSMEERMGCGVGACLVCACRVNGQYQHVCKDGPVFPAEEVDWT